MTNVTQKLCDILSEYQDEGEAKRKPVNGDTCPLDDMMGFESDFIPEVVRRLAREVFGEPLPKGTRVKNIFVNKGKKLTVNDIGNKFEETYPSKGVKV